MADGLKREMSLDALGDVNGGVESQEVLNASEQLINDSVEEVVSGADQQTKGAFGLGGWGTKGN